MQLYNPENNKQSDVDFQETEISPYQLLKDLIKSRLTNSQIVEVLEVSLPARPSEESDD